MANKAMYLCFLINEKGTALFCVSSGGTFTVFLNLNHLAAVIQITLLCFSCWRGGVGAAHEP